MNCPDCQLEIEPSEIHCHLTISQTKTYQEYIEESADHYRSIVDKYNANPNDELPETQIIYGRVIA